MNIMPQKIVNSDESLLFSKWVEDMQKNPSFEQIKQDQLQYKTKEFYHSIVNSLHSDAIESFNFKAFEPLLNIWHTVLAEQRTRGFTIKDTAMLIFSLKGSLMRFLEQNSEFATHQLTKMNQLLDVLGLLTFEMYSTEKETVIEEKNEQIQYFLKHQLDTGNYFLSASAAMQAVYRAIGLVLENDISVLLEGESGTGKDLIATLIHANSKRKNAPFITLNCGAIPKDLVESELFGHEKGAFTGALEQRIGKFELAQNGTIFLDEIGELSLDLQVKLLRVIQNKEIERIGGKNKIIVNTRIIAATNKNLKDEVDHRRFRLDLYYRLNVFPIRIPSLRERKEDIVPLADFFIKKYAPEYNPKVKNLSVDAKIELENQFWEGNIRELENAIQRAILLTSGDTIHSDAFSQYPSQTQRILVSSCAQHHDVISLDQLEKNAMLNAISVTEGNIKKAAQALGISRTTFYNKAKKYKIHLGE